MLSSKCRVNPSSYEIGESSRSRQSRRMLQLIIDFIGRVVDIQDVTNKSRNKLLGLKMQAESGEIIKVDLWRQIADAFNIHAAMYGSDITIIAVTSLRVLVHIDTLQPASRTQSLPIEACFIYPICFILTERSTSSSHNLQ